MADTKPTLPKKITNSEESYALAKAASVSQHNDDKVRMGAQSYWSEHGMVAAEVTVMPVSAREKPHMHNND